MKQFLLFLILLLTLAGIGKAQIIQGSDPYDNYNFFYHVKDSVFLKPFYKAGFVSIFTDTNTYVKKYGNFTKENDLTVNGRIITDTFVTDAGSFIPKNTGGIRFTKSLTLTDTLYSAYVSTGNMLAGNINVSNVTNSAGGQILWQGRSVLASSVNGYVDFFYNNVSTRANLIGGDYIADDSSKGLVLKDGNGHYWRISVSTSGVLSTTDLGTTRP